MINESKIKSAEQCLIDNGVDPSEAPTVLQAIGYILFDAELYPQNSNPVPPPDIGMDS